MQVGLGAFLALAAVLFSLGLYGAVSKRSAVDGAHVARGHGGGRESQHGCSVAVGHSRGDDRAVLRDVHDGRLGRRDRTRSRARARHLPSFAFDRAVHDGEAEGVARGLRHRHTAASRRSVRRAGADVARVAQQGASGPGGCGHPRQSRAVRGRVRDHMGRSRRAPHGPVSMHDDARRDRPASRSNSACSSIRSRA